MGHHQAEQQTYCRSPKRTFLLKKAEKIFEEILAENFPNLMKGMNIYIQEAQQTLSRMNLKRSIPGHITDGPQLMMVQLDILTLQWCRSNTHSVETIF